MKPYFILLLILFCSVSNAQTKENLISKDSLDRIFSQVIDKEGPGTGIMILGKSNKVLYKKGFGYADIKSQRKADNQTQFNIASISKSFTCMAIMQLVEEGKLAVTDTVGKFYPGFPKGDKITIHQLMTHTSGISDTRNYDHCLEKAGLAKLGDSTANQNDLSEFVFVSIENYLNTDGIFEILKQQPEFSFEPGTEGKWEYSNRGYVVLSKIIEKVSGMDFIDYMRQKVFLPLGMKNTFVYNRTKENEIMHYASCYVPEGNGWKKVFDLIPSTVGDGNVYTTLDDWIQYEKCLSGQFPNVISKKSLDEILKEQVRIDISKYKLDSTQHELVRSYGYGWFIHNEPNKLLLIEHSGGNIGVFCYRMKDERDDLTFAIFSSTKPYWDILPVFWEYAMRNGITNPL